MYTILSIVFAGMISGCALLPLGAEPKRGQTQGAGEALTAEALASFISPVAGGRVEVWMKGRGWVTLRPEDVRVVVEPTTRSVARRN
jgi:hypothetical protein